MSNSQSENGWKSVEVSLNDVINCIDDDDFVGLSSLIFGHNNSEDKDA